MLSNEFGMPAPRRLSTIIRRFGWSKALGNEVFGMLKDSRKSALDQVAAVLIAKAKTPPEGRTSESRKGGVQIAHRP